MAVARVGFVVVIAIAYRFDPLAREVEKAQVVHDPWASPAHSQPPDLGINNSDVVSCSLELLPRIG